MQVLNVTVVYIAQKAYRSRTDLAKITDNMFYAVITAIEFLQRHV